MGYVIADLNVCDFETWTIEQSIPVEVGAVARDMTYDPVTGNVYGCFFNDDGDGWVFGRMILETGTRDVLSELEVVFVVVAANSKGEIYGIDLFGDLYKFDKLTGAKTKIGSTGRTPAYSASGCFDLRTDKFYWECLESDAVARIFEVNTTDASLSLVTTLENSSELISMFIPVPEADDKAPALVDDLKVEFDGPSFDGNISFTMPASTFDGNPLSGTLSYNITRNEIDFASGKAEAGQPISIPVSVTEAGNYRFAVTTSNSVGNSPVAYSELWVGYDIPNAPQDVKLTKGSAPSSLDLSWKPVSSTVHNGYINPDDVTYRIVRQPGNVVVAENQVSTSFTEQLPFDSELTPYSYDVYAISGDVSGANTTSNTISIGVAELPFTETFDSNGIDLFYVVDANNDGYTWTYDPTWDAARIRYSSANNYTEPKDDWLFSPMVRLKSDRLYYFEFKARCYQSSEPERVEVKVGTAQTIEAMTQEVFPVQSITNDTFKTFGKYITVPADGVYSFGIHACSLADMFYLYVDDVVISEGPLLGTPNAVTNLKATAGANGALTANISFTTPTTTVDDKSLSDITSIEVKRDGLLVKTFDNPATGTTLSFEDNNALQGNNTYEVIAYNAIGQGHSASVTVFVGHDLPGLVSNVKAVCNDGSVNISWDAPTNGATGGYFDASALTYIVLRANDSAIIANGSADLTAIDENPPLGKYQQEFFAYYVFAQSPAGIGQGLMSNIVAVGTPFDMPFKESFANCNLTNDPWDVEAPDDSEGAWSIVAEGSSPTATPQDEDGGMVSFVSNYEGDSSTLYSGMIDFTNAINPVLQFYYYFVNGCRDYLTIYVSADGGDFEKLYVLSYYAQNCEDGWQKLSLDLAKYKSANYIQIAFEAESYDGEYNLHLDNINVRNLFDYNLTTTALSVPERVKVGQAFKAAATVENCGIVPASKYTVNIVVNGQVVASQDGETLLQDQTKTYTFEIVPTIHFGTEANVYATIEWSKDQDSSDNCSKVASIAVAQPNYPAVDDLTATRIGDSQVELAWNEPLPNAADGKPVVDGAEKYKAFAITNIGEWVMIDRDKSTTYGISNGTSYLTYDNACSAMSFMVFNPEKAGIGSENDAFAPHSGSQYFAAFASESGQNDDWMISPELPGTAQEISFYVKELTDEYGNEKFEVLYSTTDDDVNSFIKIGSTRQATTEWAQVKVVLPSEARYFAIHCVSEDCFIFMVDDIEYLPASAFAEELSLIGYNVYCNKQKLNEEPVEDLSYLHQLTEDINLEYYVTVVYDKGESPMSNIVALESVGIADTQLSTVKVFGANSMINVLNADGHSISIFTLDGKLIYNQANANDAHVAVADKATYIAVVGNQAYKVVVK